MPLDPTWLREQFPNLSNFSPLSRGGQKWVYQVWEQNAECMRVLKVYFPGSHPERALREVRAAELLDHPFIPSHIDIGTAPSPLGSVIWVLEQLVQGTSLKDVLKKRVATDDELYSWTHRVLDILREAESRQIYHRDVKPGNIIIDKEGHAWLLDFGLARHVDLESLTATDADKGVGTPGYAPPEQFMNLKDQIDGRADLFGLGVTMFECAKGENPFLNGAQSRDEVYQRVLNDQLPRLERNVHGSREYSDLLLAMTRRAVEHRPPSVQFAHKWMAELMRSR